MCGLAGVILGPREREKIEWDTIRDVFTKLLLANEVRGRHATGVATVRLDGEHRLYKAPVRATEFIEHPKYWSIVDGICPETTVLMGHTRWPTVGDLRPLNCQPLRTIHLISTHNGTVSNHSQLAERYDIERLGQVDSEVLFRLAARCWRKRGWSKRMVKVMTELEGTVGAVMVSKKKPEEVLLIRRGRPLALAWVPRSEEHTSELQSH